MSERLSKYLAFQLGISRREADAFIEHGHVAVDGKKAVLGARFEEGSDITIKGKPIRTGESKQYLMLNKPIGYLSSRKSQGGDPTIYNLLPEEYHALKPVGRLDKNSSGLILMTNDGDFAYEMTHPKFYKVKTYQVCLETELAPLHQQMINDHGIQLEDGVSQLTLERADDSRLNWIVTMHEGRNRQIRRTFYALGYTVSALHRTNFGNFALGDLASGSFIPVTI